MRGQSKKELFDQLEKLRMQIARGRLDRLHNAPKDTNTLPKLKKQLAVMLTIFREQTD